MTPQHVLTSSWTLTEDAFHQFLRSLHPNREQAALAYEELRLKLLYFFEMRPCSLPESLADETINRLIRKVSEGETIQHLDAYAFRVARYVYLESRRTPFLATMDECQSEEELRAAQQLEQIRQELADDLLRSGCMKKCLAKLPPATQELLVEYYQGTGREQTARRQQMAQARGLTANALYIQVHRVREKLEECLAKCLKKA